MPARAGGSVLIICCTHTSPPPHSPSTIHSHTPPSLSSEKFHCMEQDRGQEEEERRRGTGRDCWPPAQTDLDRRNRPGLDGVDQVEWGHSSSSHLLLLLLSIYLTASPLLGSSASIQDDQSPSPDDGRQEGELKYIPPQVVIVNFGGGEGRLSSGNCAPQGNKKRDEKACHFLK